MKPSTIIISLLILSGAIFVIQWTWREWRKEQRAKEHEFNLKYSMIQRFIYSAQVTPENYDIIQRMFMCLNKLPHKNREKTSVLYVSEFLFKFKEEVRRRQTEDEFSPEETFKR